MINTVNDSIYLAGFFIFCIITASYSQETKQLISSSEADTWVVTDAIGRSVVGKRAALVWDGLKVRG